MLTRDMKYIIYDDGLADVAILFPNHIQHGSMAMMLAANPISAGFVKFEATPDGVKPVCFGESVSLKNLSSRPDLDSEIIAQHMRT